MSSIDSVNLVLRRPAFSQRVRSWLAVVALFSLVVSGVIALLTISPAAADGSPCGGTINPIACENQQPGTPESVWNVPGAGDPSILGFATDISVNAGNPIGFKINTNASAYKIDVYRLGYYGGDGARKVASLTPSVTLPQIQPACATTQTGDYDCGTWGVSATWSVPSSAVSGVYLADLIRTDTGGKSQITFLVRNDASTSDIVYQTSDETWEAYNRYGLGDFYTGNEQAIYDSPNRARQISYNRPFITRGDSSGQDFLFSNEYPTIRYLERNGYDVSYIAGVDTDRYGAQLLKNHKVFMSVGHDEYWSQPQRTNVENARDSGVNLMFLSGNEVFWHTRFAPSVDGTNTPYRTLICYKDTWDNKVSDPSGESTGTWRDPRFSAAPGGSSPENALTGTIYMANSDDLPLVVTAAQGKTRLWRNTGLGSMTGPSTTVEQHVIGYESDEDLDNGFRNAGQIDLSTTVGASPQELNDFGQYTSAGTTTHHITLYRAASGALVFGAGTIQWGWGLDADHDGTQLAASPAMQQMMVNLFAEMNVQPQTLMSGLVTATASTDTTAPTSTITSPTSGQAVANGASLTVSGTASDVGGLVGGVEVSVDGGATWHPATGTTSWSYTTIVHGTGPVSILSRATDDSLNTETPGAGVTISVSCPCSVFGQSIPKTVDSGDAYRAELGMRFTPDTSGYVTGVRFYKSAANTGTHIGTLWSSTGTQLATGTFSGETASGWQTLQFASPVAVSAGTTYVVGYWAPNGHYSEDDLFFYYHDVDASPLHAQANSPTDSSKKNGVYASSNSFPSQTDLGANYFVDAVFQPSANSTPSVVSMTPVSGATGVPVTVAPTAMFSTAVDPSSIVFSVTGPAGAVAGSVSYSSSSKTATFTPAASLSSASSYSVSVSANSTTGVAMASPSTWTFTTGGQVTCPCTLFPAGATPGTVDSGDGGALTVGVTFSASVSGYVSGVRFYKSGANTGTHTGSVWSADGTRLATGTFSGESASGWQTLQFAHPVAVSANTTYVASYYAPSGHYSEDDHYFDTPLTNGLLTAPTGAGVYAYGGSSAFPSSAYANANYWVDPIFTTTPPPPPATPPTVTSTTPADGAVGVATSASVAATFSDSVTASSVNLTVSRAGSPIAGSVAYADATRTATFTPSVALSAGTQYTASVSATGTNGAAMSSPVTWSFTVAAATACPCTLFADNAVPTTVDGGDRSAVNLGVQFSSSTAGSVTGIRFYKAAANTGTHTGTLWTAAGAQLATGTFTGESGSGWQTLVFDTPVAISASTTYVVSYFDPLGHYSEDVHYFDAPVTNGPLTAPTGAGVYAYGGTPAFPSAKYANANYWVDPIFTTTTPPPTVPPTVTSVAPAAGSSGVATTSQPSAVFSIPVAASSITFTLTGPSGAVTGSTSYAAGSQTATFTPSTALAAGATFTASVTASSSADGTPMSGPQAWTFTTAAAPVAPTVTSVVPAAGSSGVATTSKPSATFSIPVTPSSITFSVTGPSGAVSGAASYAAGSQTATFTPSAALAAGTTFTASVTASSSADGTPMSGPQTWTFTTAAAADATPPVITAVAANGSGSAATVTWATDEPASSSVAYGTSTGALTSSATAAGLTKAHSVSLTGLTPNTRYYYRVTSADAAANSATSPAAPAAPAAYAPTVAPSSDSTTSDFGSGSASSTYAASNGDGEVVLLPKTVAEFTGTTLPSGLTSSVVATGGRTTVVNGLASLSGTSVTTTSGYGNGVALETLALLAPGQRIAWVTGSNSAVQMAFSVNSTKQLVATANDGVFNNASSVVASNWNPLTAHIFRVEWTSSAATFYVDGTQVYSHAFTSWYGSTYRPVFTDPSTVDPPMVIDWLRISPYAASGTFTSRVFDDVAPVNWGALTWDASVPSGTTLVVKVRTGSTASPGSAWTAWKTVSASGASIGTTARYLQYQLTLTSTGSRFVTPSVRSVQAAAGV